MSYISGSTQVTGSSVFVDTFIGGVDYTPGTSSQVTLSETPATVNSIWVFFNGIVQHHTEFSLTGNVLVFTEVIPTNVGVIEVQNNTQLAVGVPGTNTVEYISLTSNAVTSLQRKNVIINGNFNIWQRGTTHSTVGYGSADRWYLDVSGTAATYTMSQQAFALGQTLVPNEPEFFLRNTISSGTDTATYIQLYQSIEDVRTFAGQTITISFWATSPTSLDTTIELQQFFGTGGAPSATVYGDTPVKVSLTPSWNKYEVTLAVPSITGKTLGTNNNDCFRLAFWLSAGSIYNLDTDTLGLQTGTIDIAQIQVEKGTTATNFERRSYGEELSLCQRYYWKRDATISASNERICTGGISITTTGGQCAVRLPVAMRATPTLSHGTLSSIGVYDGSVSQAVTSLGTAEASTELYNLSWNVGAAVTQWRPIQITRVGAASDAWVAFDAEL